MMKRLAAETIGTAWLVLGGCGSAVLAAGFPLLGIGFVGVSLAFGLTVLTMAFALGHISGAHFNPAVTVGLCASGRFPKHEVVQYIVSQVIGGIAGAAVLYCIASGKPGFDARASGFASNGYGEHSPGGYTFQAAVVAEFVLMAFFCVHHSWCHRSASARSICPDRDRSRAYADPFDQHSSHEHLGEPGAQHGRRPFPGRLGAPAAVGILGRSAAGRRRGRARLPVLA
jgi:glycerol uptake facilitator-like aquaporin